MTRLLHLLSTDQRRGAETFGTELAEHLSTRGFEVELLALTPSPNGPHLPVATAGRTRIDPRGLMRVISAARHAEVVVGFGSTTLLTGAAAARATRRPFVYRNIGDPRHWGAVRCAQARIGRPLRAASRVVAVFPRAREDLIARYRLDPLRVCTIPRGVPAERWPPVEAADRMAARQRLGLDERPWLVWIGSLTEEKDPLAAIDIVVSLPRVGLLMCGDGPLAPEIRRRSSTLDAPVRLLGAVDDIGHVLAAADALLLTSRTEGVPGVIIEAGLSGIPAVATDVGGVGWLIEDGVTGHLYPPGRTELAATAVERVLAAGGFGIAARQRCLREFSMDAVGSAWERLLRDVVGGPAT